MDVSQLESQLNQWQYRGFYSFYKDLTAKPRWRLAILTCMDCRITSEVFGTREPGNVIIIRTAGALLTTDSLRSLLIAIYELGVNFIAIVGHTDCGGRMTDYKMEDLVERISSESNRDKGAVLSLLNARSAREAFLGFEDVDKQIQKTVTITRKHPLIPSGVQVAGFKYDTALGTITRLA
ncbi:MAG: beta-class carbonic anhydrase [Candidatus Odinarchaeota archaeon]